MQLSEETAPTNKIQASNEIGDITLNFNNKIFLSASADSQSSILSKFYRDCAQAFVLQNEKETLSGFKSYPAMNWG